ncbi:MAG TPA: cytochrome c peroxidase [Dinghuibacter sp.]|uniref:cytochrome-c peroxidase n=1 Tax=Dinghuibacter sp. TaxID=2024697 RepID=UPI002C62A0C8|nr:cytochrome c peroxidase [Dinghuibacter sp.]HTJ12585.1 cytochrome c peroxidase [Dinghuibacter sp.]
MKATLLVLALSLLAGTFAEQKMTRPADDVLGYVRAAFGDFARSADSLNEAVRHPGDGRAMERALLQCRLRYKRIEFFLEYFFRSAALIYNQPAKYEVEEPFMEYEAPRGLQLIEDMLYARQEDSTKGMLIEQSRAVAESARDLGSLLYGFHLEDAPLMESLRLELIRVMTLGITGYDAPLSKSGVEESEAAMEAIDRCLQPYLAHGGEADSIRFYLDQSLRMLRASPGFDGFDRLAFLVRGALPLQRHLGEWIDQNGLFCQTVPTLDYRSADLFSPGAIDLRALPGGADVHALPGNGRVALAERGRELFSDPSLSSDGSRSCATCHRPGTYFTDGRVVSPAMPGFPPLRRNTPTLLYAAYQYSQFWDGRARSLEDQVADVLTNRAEMGIDTSRKDVRKAAAALAAYVRTLTPFNSRFDRYMTGDRRALTPDDVRGFNLFMGKARCATCHFAPLFNGLRPPLYDVTEYEVLGTPATADLLHPVADTDKGRYGVYPIPFYRGAFKTPTVRNTAVTAPYMHNGSLPDISTLVAFYNRGGGKGIGLAAAGQTLSGDTLHLSAKEVRQLTAFLNALTDRSL